jgi:Tol biopolymer transport system component
MRVSAWQTACAMGLVGLVVVGVAGAAPAPGGRIVFASRLPAYPLPDNFQQTQLFSIGLNGKGRVELTRSPHWVWSSDDSGIYFTRDTSAGAEVWAERADGSGVRRLALLAGSGPVISLAWSPGDSQLVVTADALWLVGADGSDPRSVFTPPPGTAISEMQWSPDRTQLTLIAGDLWSVATDGSGSTRLFRAGGKPITTYSLSPDRAAVIVSAGDTWLIPSAGARAVDLTSDEVDGARWDAGDDAAAVEAISLAGCGLGSTKCAEWYQLIVDRTGTRLGRIDDARDAAWSPDGTRLAFESGPLAVAPEEGTIDIANRDGTGRLTVSGGVAKADQSCWSYPGWVGAAQLTFDEATCDPEDNGSTITRSVVVAVPSGRLIKSSSSSGGGGRRGGGGGVPSPNHKFRAYRRSSGNDVALYVSAAGSMLRTRLSPRHGEVDEMAWSPDSRSLAFTFGNDYGDQIYVASVRSGRARQLTHEPGRSWEGNLTFTDGGRRLRYDSEVDALYGSALWTMNADGTGVRRLTREASDDSAPAWSRDGRRVAFTRAGLYGDDTGIAIVNSDGSGERRVTGGAKDASPEWSPDGKRIAFTREQNGTYYLSITNADGTGAHILRSASGVYGRPSWSPDGRSVVYSDSGTTIMSIAPDGTHKHALVRTDCTSPTCTGFTDLAFSPNGARIAIACQYCDPSTPFGLWTIGADGTGLTLVAAVPAGRPSWSSDGRSIVFDCGPSHPPNLQSVEEVCAVNADGSDLRAVTTWAFETLDPSWSPH